ncbi:hypothetical protein T11_17275 [Trichinella zimbabwensis]|uniref:Uncharacterized protein n=1 Tax=Trichinella zimbabwensis TaxID=268475 RepID=A0A0V1HCK8_9BILA|nr:hypothetical protein T11_17275 [Trichinella zimbabwensis]
MHSTANNNIDAFVDDIWLQFIASASEQQSRLLCNEMVDFVFVCFFLDFKSANFSSNHVQRSCLKAHFQAQQQQHVIDLKRKQY